MLNFGYDCDSAQGLAGGCGGVFHSRNAVRLFRFHRDLLFLVGCAAYAVNRLILKPHLHSPFLHSHFNDLWLIPCALPLVLWVHRWAGWRSDEPPTLGELVSHLLLWSVLFEWWGPHLIHHVTGDPGDVACYWAGGLLAWAWWNRGSLLYRFNPA